MKVLMFGWEFPPVSSGGLGTACYGLTKALSSKGVDITLVLPSAADIDADFVKVIGANTLKIRKVDSILMPYLNSASYYSTYQKVTRQNAIYGRNLFQEVSRYTEAAAGIAEEEDFDIIHCHDWMTFGAGIRAKQVSKKPLVVHIHATEFDRTGGNGVHQHVYDIEREGMHKADKVVAVSNFTKQKILQHYGVQPQKVAVVHNGVELDRRENAYSKEKMVLFLGRITLQKGPDYFLYAAKRALEIDKDIRFVIAGSGDMEPLIVEKAAELGIADKVLFAGFLEGEKVREAYQKASLYVMPSVSEPFGLTPLEAMNNRTPVIISRQSGVSEVISHCLKVDFWDVNQIANQMISVLRYSELQQELSDNASAEVRKFNWASPAEKCISIYNGLLTAG